MTALTVQLNDSRDRRDPNRSSPLEADAVRSGLSKPRSMTELYSAHGLSPQQWRSFTEDGRISHVMVGLELRIQVQF